MKAKVSPLEIRDFKLLESKYKFEYPEDDHEINIKALFDAYQIDIDFAHNESEENGVMHVACRIGVNNIEKKVSGYVIYVEAVGVFSVKNLINLDEALVGNLKYYSSLNMMINNIRNIIFQQTNLGPLEAYLLPAIDIRDLFKQKQKRKN